MEKFILAIFLEMITAFIVTSISFIKLILYTINNTKNDIAEARIEQLRRASS